LDLLLTHVDSNTIINNITSDDIVNFIVLLKDSNNKNGKPFKPGTINSYLKHLKAAFNWAVKEKLIIENSFKDVN
jgi:site-specific recombinase XerD